MTTELKQVEVSVAGRRMAVASRTIGQVNVIFTGRLPRVVRVHQEDWMPEQLKDPDEVLAALRQDRLGADYFVFGQSFTDTRPLHPYHFEWDNIAAIPVISYQDWWDHRVSADLRKDIRRAEKRGVTTRVADFNDDFVRGIKEIYDEVPVRQGRPFWHYQKEFDRVKAENASFLGRSIFLGAYHGEELIGFIKIVRCTGVARMMQIISKESHTDKRPTNALIAAAVRWAAEGGYKYVTYGKYTYDGKKNSTVVQFKRRNGFEEILYPRYFVPLCARGEVLIRAGVHRGFRRFVPERMIEIGKAVRLRARLQRARVSQPATISSTQ